MRAAVPGGFPRAVALGLPQAGVEDDNAGIEARAEAIERLGGEPDFGYEHQRLPAAGQAIGDQLQVNLGFTGAGYALKQMATEALPDPQQGGQDGGLFPVECQSGVAAGHHRRLCQCAFFNQFLAVQLAQHRGADPAFPEPGVAHRRCSLQQRQRLGLPRRPGQPAHGQAHAPGSQAPAGVAGRLVRLALSQRAREGGAQYLGRRMVIVAGGPVAQLQQGGRHQRFGVQQHIGMFQFGQWQVAVLAYFHQVAGDCAPTEGHGQAQAGLQAGCIATGHVPGGQVVEQAAQRGRYGEAKYGHCAPWRAGG